MRENSVAAHGRVWCPRRNCDLDLETCMVCPYFQGIQDGRDVCDFRGAFGFNSLWPVQLWKKMIRSLRSAR